MIKLVAFLSTLGVGLFIFGVTHLTSSCPTPPAADDTKPIDKIYTTQNAECKPRYIYVDTDGKQALLIDCTLQARTQP